MHESTDMVHDCAKKGQDSADVIERKTAVLEESSTAVQHSSNVVDRHLEDIH